MEQPLLFTKDGKPLPSLRWGMNDGQDRCIDEIVTEFENNDDEGKQKVLYLNSKCGSGKSVIIINAIKRIGKGRGIIIVPSKVLQNQYMEDYSNKTYILKDDRKLKISTMFGRNHFKCRWMEESKIFNDDKSNSLLDCNCDSPNIPCKRLKSIKTIASECPYYIPTPISHNTLEVWEDNEILDDLKKCLKGDTIETYQGINSVFGLFIRNNRDNVCEYYRQFYDYIDSDIIVMNKAKWEIETYIGRKPLLDVECFDEGDEFLLGLNKQITISRKAVNNLIDDESDKTPNEIKHLRTIRQNILSTYDKAYNDIRRYYPCFEDFGLCKKLSNFIESFNIDLVKEKSERLMYNIDSIKRYEGYFITSTNDVDEDNPTIKYNISCPDIVLQGLMNKSCSNILYSSATMINDDILNDLYKLKFDKVVFGRLDQPCEDFKIPTTKGFNMTNVTYQDREFDEYHKKLIYCVEKLNPRGNTMVLGFKSYNKYLLKYLEYMQWRYILAYSGDDKSKVYNEDATNNTVTLSYGMNRGVDLKDDLCRVIIWNKYPLMNTFNNPHFDALVKRFGKNKAYEFMHNVADLEIIQGVCRGLRHVKDYCTFATPDLKVYDVVKKWWDEQEKIRDDIRTMCMKRY